jgi:hypothetical protein
MVEEAKTAVGGEWRRQGNDEPWLHASRSASRHYVRDYNYRPYDIAFLCQRFLRASVVSFRLTLEHIRSFLSQDFPEDAADQDIAALLQHLDRIDSIGNDVEGRIDAVLEKLDSLLGTLQPDTSPQTVEAQGGSTTPQREDLASDLVTIVRVLARRLSN